MDASWAFLQNFNWYYLLIVPGLLTAFTVHELGHSITAYFLGDTSQAENGRITANPLRHMSWFGAILFVLFGIGWPKPMYFNPEKFKDRSLDALLVSLAGPAGNLLVAVITFLLSLGLLFILQATQVITAQQMEAVIFYTRQTDPSVFGPGLTQSSAVFWLVIITNRVWMANFTLGVVSLIPLPPFNGFYALMSFLGIWRDRRLSELTQDDPQPSISEELVTPKAETPSKKQTIADIHFQKGVAYHQQSQFDDAIARYRSALQTNPAFGPAYVNMGLAYKAKGQTKEAIHALRGATQYASDELSQNQAWAELHTLNAITNLPATVASPSRLNTGAIPWTDTTPTPNWVGLGVGLFALVLIFSCPVLMVILNLMGS